MKRFLLFIFVFVGLTSFSQPLIFDDAVVLQRGMYKNFEEFKFNKPSIPLSFTIDSFEYKNLDRAITTGGNHITYNIFADKQEARRIGPIYGFCDGKRVFINETEQYLGEKADFELLQFIGLYSYFEQYMFLPGELGAPNASTVLKKAVNGNNGTIIPLTEPDLFTLFENDSVLYKSFEKVADKKSKIKDYLIRYSIKHKHDGLYCRDKKMTRAEADSMIIPRTDDLSDTIYYDRVGLKLTTNPAFSDAKLDKLFYPNGKRKSIGFTTRCNFDPNDQFLYCVGLWQFFYETGQLREEVFYSILSKLLSRKKYDKNGKLLAK